MASGNPALRLYNTLTREKADFVPLDPGNVRMYVCGPTVYDFAHIGNARPVIVFDVLFRLLRHLAAEGVWDGGKGETKVTYVRNITDVDDKINARAARDFPDLPLNEAIRKVTEATNAQFQADVKALGCLEPTVQPRATEHIAEMIAMNATLIDKGHAYAADGHVLFDVKSFKVGDEVEYGKLAHRSLDEMLAGARVEVAPYKRDPMDFVLWKPSSPEEPGWGSPWGRGRPGWHIECSAMSEKHLGEVFDIHGGGIDLAFPHHENELAQSRCAHGTKIMAQVWMHNGFLQVEGQKMSKSLGNFVTINELLNTDKFGGRKWPGPVLRLAMLRTHYRQPIDWTVDNLFSASESLAKWRAFSGERTTKAKKTVSLDKFLSLLTDDLNTPGAMALVDEVVAYSDPSPADRYFVFEAMKLLGFQSPLTKTKRAADAITSVNTILGAMDISEVQRIVEVASSRPAYRNGKLRPEARFLAALNYLSKVVDARQLRPSRMSSTVLELYERTLPSFDDERRRRDRIDQLVSDRLAAIDAKDFATADKIRAELLEQGIQLKDSKNAAGERVTTWEIKR